MADESSETQEPSPDQKPESGNPWISALRDAAPFIDLGWRLMGSVSIPMLAGWGLDMAFDSLPWGVLIGSALGMAGAVRILINLYHTPPQS